MPERFSITKVNPDPRDPALSLARIVSKREAGEDTRNRITDTKEFTYLQLAYAGDTEFFRDTGIVPTEFILTDNPRRFFKFYNFLRTLAYDRAIDKAAFQEDPLRVKELKLESRGNWTPRFKWYQKPFVPRYIESTLARVYNLVTTGNERPTVKDRFLDLIMG